MKNKQFLMIPGPTPVPESVLLAMAKHPIGHRSSEFSKVLEEVYENLKYVKKTKNDPKKSKKKQRAGAKFHRTENNGYLCIKDG